MKLKIGDNIRRLRNDRQVTCRALADHLGLTSQAVSRWENGQCYPDIELLPDIARFFDCTLEELLGDEKARETVSDRVAQLSGHIFPDGRAALKELRSLERKYPNDWHVKEGICNALCEGANYRDFGGEGEDVYDEIMPELRRYGMEAATEIDAEAMLNVPWIYRSLILTAPEEEVEEWAARLHANPYNTREANLLLRYTDYRRDKEKAARMQQAVILLYIKCLSSQLRCPDQSLAGWSNAERLRLRLYDAVSGIPCAENGVVYNTLLLYERILCAFQLAANEAEIGHEDAAAEAMARGVHDLLLYADARGQTHLTADNAYFDLPTPLTEASWREDVFDSVLNICLNCFPDWAKERTWHREQVECIRACAERLGSEV